VIVDNFATWGPRDYVELPFIHDQWKVLDVGPGAYPLARADVYLDQDPERLEPLDLEGKETMLGNIEDGVPAIMDQAFDYVWCSHVLEHVENPQKAAATLSRIAKRGTIVMPSAIKEAIFNFEEEEHRWLVLPNPVDGKPPIFVRHNHGYLSKLKDNLVQKATCFLYRTGTHHECTAERALRGWFQTHEKDLDVIFHWTDELQLIVIG